MFAHHDRIEGLLGRTLEVGRDLLIGRRDDRDAALRVGFVGAGDVVVEHGERVSVDEVRVVLTDELARADKLDFIGFRVEDEYRMGVAQGDHDVAFFEKALIEPGGERFDVVQVEYVAIEMHRVADGWGQQARRGEIV